MLKLKEDIMSYLKEHFSENGYFPNIKIVESNLYNNYLEREQITVSIVDESEELRFTTFENAEINNVAIQINCYGLQRKMDGVARTAMYVSEFIAEIAEIAFNKRFITKYNENIKSIRKVSTIPPMPLKEGSQVYVTILRYELLVDYDYIKK